MPFYINDTEITDEQVFAEMQYHPAPSLPEAQKKAAEALAVRALLLQEAARLGITAPEGLATQETVEDFVISRLLEQEVITPDPEEAACRHYYEQNLKTFRDAEGNPVLFTYVHTAIAAYLKEASWQMAIKQYLKMLAGKARIAGIRLHAADNPLVQ